MLDQTLIALAASGGTAVVTAAGTDAWAGLRQAIARWLGRGDARREQRELERLDQTAVVLQSAGSEERQQESVAWQTRIAIVLQELDDPQRARAVEELGSLIARHAPAGGASAGPGGLAVQGDANISADGGSIAAGVIHGGVHLGTPTPPDPSQG